MCDTVEFQSLKFVYRSITCYPGSWGGNITMSCDIVISLLSSPQRAGRLLLRLLSGLLFFLLSWELPNKAEGMGHEMSPASFLTRVEPGVAMSPPQHSTQDTCSSSSVIMAYVPFSELVYWLQMFALNNRGTFSNPYCYVLKSLRVQS